MPKHKPIPQQAIDGFKDIAACSTFAITHLSYDMKRGDHTHTIMAFPTGLDNRHRVLAVTTMICGTIRDVANQLGQNPAEMAKAIEDALTTVPNTKLIWSEEEICQE